MHLSLYGKKDKDNRPPTTSQAGDNSNKIDMSNVREVFSRFTKKSGKRAFCDTCIIYMESCHLGLGPIPQEIANVTGCTVRAALGFSGGKPRFPEWSKSTYDIKALRDVNHYLEGNKYGYPVGSSEYKFFEPNK